MREHSVKTSRGFEPTGGDHVLEDVSDVDPDAVEGPGPAAWDISEGGPATYPGASPGVILTAAGLPRSVVPTVPTGDVPRAGWHEIRSGLRRMSAPMNEVTRILSAIEAGDPQAAEQLLPLVYDELRRLAAQRLAGEGPGHTLQPTALVHEAYLKLVGADPQQPWNGRVHFFAAAAEAMRRILIDHARRKHRARRGGGKKRVELGDMDDIEMVAESGQADELLALDEALTQLAAADPRRAELVRLRYFAGLTLEQAAELLGISRATADRHWAFARAWLYDAMTRGHENP